jgi:hypothetical protein
MLALKNEIMAEVRAEISKAKDEIIAAMRRWAQGKKMTVAVAVAVAVAVWTNGSGVAVAVWKSDKRQRRGSGSWEKMAGAQGRTLCTLARGWHWLSGSTVSKKKKGGKKKKKIGLKRNEKQKQKKKSKHI